MLKFLLPCLLAFSSYAFSADKIVGIVLSRTDSIPSNDQILTDVQGSHGQYFVREHYANALKEICKGIHVIFLDPNPESVRTYASMIDGLLIPGNNNDIDPDLYGEKPIMKLTTEKYRNEFEIELISELAKMQKPILGICGGNQIINVAFGGTLWQDIPSQVKKDIKHTSADVEIVAHEVEIKGGILQKNAGNQVRYAVNSMHHQAVKKVAEGFTVIAQTDDGVVEGIQKKNYPFMVGVQWHPEFQLSKYDTKLFESFCKAVKTEKQKHHIKGALVN
jgi:putative glutamine amidotransferase